MTSKLTIEMFVERASQIHNNRYNYSESIYVNNKTRLIIICPTHGKFEQQPSQHLLGHGCMKCGKQEMSQQLTYSNEEFIKRCNEVHKDYYDYSLTQFVHMNKKIKIVCPKHGVFEQKANSHVNSSGCSKCAKVSSKLENDWLNLVGIPNDISHRHVTLKIGDSWFVVDGFDPNTQTVYEFYGDFWHGNPKIYDMKSVNNATKCSFGSLYERTVNKENILRESGYNVVSIWESDYKETL